MFKGRKKVVGWVMVTAVTCLGFVAMQHEAHAALGSWSLVAHVDNPGQVPGLLRLLLSGGLIFGY